MQIPAFISKLYIVVYPLLKANYLLCLLISFSCAVLGLVDNNSPFNNNVELYGPLANNLKIMLVYLFFAELSLYFLCSLKHDYQNLVFVGAFLLMILGALPVYGEMNQIPVNEVYYLFFLYTGLSHLLFGSICFVKREKLNNL